MKYLFIVDYWIPFPSSEYGGLVNVIAEDNEECHDVLLNWRDEYLSKYDNLIIEKVVKAPRYALTEDFESDVVESFTT